MKFSRRFTGSKARLIMPSSCKCAGARRCTDVALLPASCSSLPSRCKRVYSGVPRKWRQVIEHSRALTVAPGNTPGFSTRTRSRRRPSCDRIDTRRSATRCARVGRASGPVRVSRICRRRRRGRCHADLPHASSISACAGWRVRRVVAAVKLQRGDRAHCAEAPGFGPASRKRLVIAVIVFSTCIRDEAQACQLHS